MGSDSKRVIEPDPEAAPVIVRLFEQYATGNYSARDLARMARAEGLVSRKSRAPVPRATVNNILRNSLYAGDFEWDGNQYRGTHTPLVTRELWERVQEVVDRRLATKRRRTKHEFAFSGLISCGHCGCSLVGEVKKGRYVYYHCTGFKGKCGEPYTREEILAEHFSKLLKDLTFDDDVMEWVTAALRESHRDETVHHEHAIARLQAEYGRLQARLDAMYVDKLDGNVDAVFFNRKATEWRHEQARLLRTIEEHQTANRTYLDDGIRLLELARRAHELFMKQRPREKRRLLDFVVSNCTWKNGGLQPTYRQPFNILAVSTKAWAEKQTVAGCAVGLKENWLPGLVSNQRLPD